MQNLVDALQKENVKKSGVERSLASLVQKGVVTKKEYGKTKLFIQAQADIELPDEETTRAEEEEIKSLQKSIADIGSELSEARAKEVDMRSQLTMDEAREQCEGLEKEVERKSEKLNALGDPSELPTKEDKLKVEVEYYRMRMAWKKRKRVVKNIVDTISEAMQKKPKELIDMIGIEADEEVGVNIADFPEIPDPSKAPRGAGRAVKRQRLSS